MTHKHLIESLRNIAIIQREKDSNVQLAIDTASPTTDTVTLSKAEYDEFALNLSRKIMVEVREMTVPIAVRRMPQLQAKIQCLIVEAIDQAKDE
jgi:hypothetical protein